MLTADELTAMRTTVESAMPDTCTITRRVTPVGVLDPATAAFTVTAPAALWSGPCRVRSRETAARDVQVGDAHAALGLYVATVPAAAVGFDVDDYLTVTATASTFSVELIGVPLQILEVQLGSWDLGRRLILQAAK
jgi:hypothetical protein